MPSRSRANDALNSGTELIAPVKLTGKTQFLPNNIRADDLPGRIAIQQYSVILQKGAAHRFARQHVDALAPGSPINQKWVTSLQCLLETESTLLHPAKID